MRKQYDEYFQNVAQLKKRDTTPKERLDLLDKLSMSLRDWGTHVFDDKSFEWFIHYKETNGGLPFAGAWEDQPRYVQEDLHHWSMLARWWELNEELSSADGLPSMNDLK